MASFITESELARELASNPDFWPWASILCHELAFIGPDPSEAVQDAPDDAVEPGMAD